MSVPTSHVPAAPGSTAARTAAEALGGVQPFAPDPAASFAPSAYPIHRFSVAEYERIGRLGILAEDDHVELLEGWIVPKMPKYPPHDGTIDLLQFLLARMLPPGWYLRVQNVIVTDDSEPEPDLAIVRGQPGAHRTAHPSGGEIGLVIEVADSTVLRDRRKAVIYAGARIPQYWIVNLAQRQIEVYSQPAGTASDAVYQSEQVMCDADEALTVTLGGQAIGTITVRDVLA